MQDLWQEKQRIQNILSLIGRRSLGPMPIQRRNPNLNVFHSNTVGTPAVLLGIVAYINCVGWL